MSDTLMAIVGIVLAVITMFIFPLMQVGGTTDELSQTITQVAVANFVNRVSAQGKITEFDYNTLITDLYSTGNSYEIQMEVKILDDNARRVSLAQEKSELGEYKYYSVYTNEILSKIESDKEYILKNDDYIIVTVKNTNITLGTQFKNFLYKMIGKEAYTIGASATGLVLNSG